MILFSASEALKKLKHVVELIYQTIRAYLSN